MREQRVVLEHGIHRAPVGWQAFDLLAEDFDMAGVRLLEAGDEAQARRLAGAGGAEHGEELARQDGEVDAVHRLHRPEVPRHAARSGRQGLLGRCRSWRAWDRGCSGRFKCASYSGLTPLDSSISALARHPEVAVRSAALEGRRPGASVARACASLPPAQHRDVVRHPAIIGHTPRALRRTFGDRGAPEVDLLEIPGAVGLAAVVRQERVSFARRRNRRH